MVGRNFKKSCIESKLDKWVESNHKKLVSGDLVGPYDLSTFDSVLRFIINDEIDKEWEGMKEMFKNKIREVEFKLICFRLRFKLCLDQKKSPWTFYDDNTDLSCSKNVLNDLDCSKKTQKFEMDFSNGSYTGEVVNNLPHGIGQFKNSDEFYLGQWVNGEKTGIGEEMKGKGKVTYEGYWNKNKKCGYGIEKIEQERSSYEGEWKDDAKNGKGQLTQSFSRENQKVFSGVTYNGKWKNNKMNGEGRMDYNYNGGKDTYNGEWKNGMKNGTGTMEYPNSSLYTGQWQDDKRHGHGTINYLGSIKYEGEWEQDEQHGEGTIEYPGGPVRSEYSNVQHNTTITYNGRWENFMTTIDCCTDEKLLERLLEINSADAKIQKKNNSIMDLNKILNK